MVGEAVEHIAHVHHNLVGEGRNGNPLAIAAQHFEAVGAGSHQKGNEVDVAVGCRPHGAVWHEVGVEWKVVQRPQNAVAIFYFFFKIIFFQIQIQRNGFEQSTPCVLESFKNFEGIFSKIGVFGGKHVLGHFVDGIGLPHVVKFFQVGQFEALGFFFSFANVAALAVQFFKFVFFLDFVGLRKKTFYRLVQLFAELWGKAVVFDGHKTNIVEGRAQVLHKLGFT